MEEPITCKDCKWSKPTELFGKTAYKCKLAPDAYFPEGWSCTDAEVEDVYKEK